MPLTIDPAMRRSSSTTWGGGRWVGTVDAEVLTDLQPTRIALSDTAGYRWARLLLTIGREVRFVELPIADGGVDASRLHETAAAVRRGQRPATSSDRLDVRSQPVSVVICTRERPGQLRDSVRSVLALDSPDFEVVVVDNAPSTNETRDVVRHLADPRVRYVVEAEPGLSRARNAGLRAAQHDLVAFTDDDTSVDGGWLEALVRPFTRCEVLCVTGSVPSGELRTEAQSVFDARVAWSSNTTPQRYRLGTPPPREPLFPFRMGLYGTGANFAVRRREWLALGGFDPCLGAGTSTRGGEDLDLFVRALFAGWTIAVEPSAIVWHRHRTDTASLAKQTRDYGRGLTSWGCKVLLDPAMRPAALRRVVPTVTQIVGKRGRSRDSAVLVEDAASGGAPRIDVDPGLLRRMFVAELLGMAAGPSAYLAERRTERAVDRVTGDDRAGALR